MSCRPIIFIGLLFSLLVLQYPIAQGSFEPIESTFSSPASLETSSTFRDDFDQPALDPEWSWVNQQVQSWSVNERPGFLRIRTQAGTLDQSNVAENILVRSAPMTPYILSTRVEFSATADYHEAALLLYHDADNYIKVSLIHSSELARSTGANQLVLLTREVNGQRSGLSVTPATASTIELRLVVSSNLVTAEFRDSAAEWKPVGSLPVPNDHVYGWVGIGAYNGINRLPAPTITADFDFVEVAPLPVPVCRSFTEAAGGQGQFSVCDDVQVRFLSAFDDWGLQRIGYPISRRYERDGFVTQAFQKAIMQWRPDTQSVALVNIFDDLHSAGFDETLLNARQTPYQLPADWDLPGATFGQIVARRQALLNDRPAIRDAYFSVVDPLLFFGLPTSEVEDMGNHYAIRLQRTVLQEWKEDVPWARRGMVTIANGGDIAKELGSLPAAVLVPEPLAVQAVGE